MDSKVNNSIEDQPQVPAPLVTGQNDTTPSYPSGGLDTTGSQVHAAESVEFDPEGGSSTNWQTNPTDPEGGEFFATYSQESNGQESIHDSAHLMASSNSATVAPKTALPEQGIQETGLVDIVETQTNTTDTSHFGTYSMSPPPLPSTSPDSTRSSHQSEVVANPQAPYDPYNPANRPRQNTQPSYAEPHQRPSSTTPWDPYAPPTSNKTPAKPAQSSYATYVPMQPAGSVNGIAAPPVPNQYDPYAPQQHRSASRQSHVSYDATYSSPPTYGYQPIAPPERAATLPADLDSTGGYANVLASYNQGPYAPSPSLLGTNDPLGRTSVRVPVISFGFGGKLVSCFHSAGDSVIGFDVNLTSRQSTTVSIHTLHEVIPASAMDSSESSYPGPLYLDPGSAGISLARTVGVSSSSNAKAKKTMISKWLEEQAEELSRSIAHIAVGSQDRYDTEGRLALLRLLKVMVDHDGQLSGR